ncbi:hypothetical protein Bca101_065714 [Brassica carinata]
MKLKTQLASRENLYGKSAKAPAEIERSNDAKLKIWDIKRWCILMYKGHIRRINTMKFSSDGRWIVTGGPENAE